MAYDPPTPADLKARYAAFAAVDDAVVQYWLTDAERFVDTSWTEADYPIGLMALAAHNMSLAGLGTEAAAVGGIPAGISKFKSASLDVSFTEGAAADRATGALSSTRYGAEFARLRRMNRGGARVTPTGSLPYDPYLRYPQGQE